VEHIYLIFINNCLGNNIQCFTWNIVCRFYKFGCWEI